VAAALLSGASRWLPSRAVDAVALAAALVAFGITVALIVRTAGGADVVWFGGWTPRHGVALGVSFKIDVFGAALAALASFLTVAAFVYSWHYYEERPGLFHALLLLFLAGMLGFAMSGDLFNLFVFFELMSVSAFALTGYRIESREPLQGALNFAVTNSVGSMLALAGIALVYARTGQLNMDAIGHELARRRPDDLVIVAFTLIAVGLLVKGAIVPFHLWLADAHAVAPPAVCALFSGVMVELGLYAVARVYWSMFAGTLDAPSVRAVLLTLGVLTALLGGVMCCVQHHLKRMLAFSTISHAGMFLVGIALLDTAGLAGSAVFLVAHGLVKAALFLAVGVLLHRTGTVSERALHGRGRALPATAAVYLVGGLVLAGVPPFATTVGKSMLEGGVTSAGYGALKIVLVLASILTAGAVLRSGMRVFLGWGDPAPEDPSSRHAEDEGEEQPEHGIGRLLLVGPAVVLLLTALALGLVPRLAERADRGAARFELANPRTGVTRTSVGVDAAVHEPGPGPGGDALTVVSIAGSLAVAASAVFGRRLVPRVRPRSPLRSPVHWLRATQTGHVGDYVAVLVLGCAAVGSVLTLTAR
jgi:multicomponent Na+:H+ antiporter subunit D